MYVNLSKLPTPNAKRSLFIADFSGGINQRRAVTDIADNQLVSCTNMLWEDGMLRSRFGQSYLPLQDMCEWPSRYKPVALYDREWNGCLWFACVKDSIFAIYSYDPAGHLCSEHFLKQIESDTIRGTFFSFGEGLYFKGQSLYLKIELDARGNCIVSEVEAYTPIVQINTNPQTGVGDLYQPENRISSQKEVWFNADNGEEIVELLCDGMESVFRLPYDNSFGANMEGYLLSVEKVYIGTALAEEGTDYTVNLYAGSITCATPPHAGQKLAVYLTRLRFTYKLPEPVDSVDEVWVKDLEHGCYKQYECVTGDPSSEQFHFAKGGDLQPGEVYFCRKRNITTFQNANITDSNVLNSFVKVKYTKANPDAKQSIEECNIATVFGSGGVEQNCVVLAGTTKQGNAYFWSGNDETGANPAYFPITHYNLAGLSNDAITAFGKQQNKLVIFQNGRIGSASFSLDEVDGRMVVSLPYRTINDRIGCDLPGSVQLVENNLVWASSRHGVMYLKDSNYAYETLVTCISENIEKEFKKAIVLTDVGERPISSFDDGKRYWLVAGSVALVWDYSLQGYTSNTEKLSWFRQACIENCGAGFVLRNGNVIGMTAECKLWSFSEDAVDDFGKPFMKEFITKTFTFGTYDKPKNIEKIVLSVPSQPKISFDMTYVTDLGSRTEQMPITTEYESSVPDAPHAIRVRAPKCRHVNEFSVCFVGTDNAPLSIHTMQIFYCLVGREVRKAGQRM